jgi:L-ascorbate metabolism protein UlaG (beta-lactamase superfamily)
VNGSTLFQLSREARVSVEYDDRSPIGGPVSERLQTTMRRWFAPISTAFRRHGAAYVVEHGPRLLRRVFADPQFEDVGKGRAGRLPRWLVFPSPSSIKPRAAIISSNRTRGAVSLAFDSATITSLHDALAALADGRCGRDTRLFSEVRDTLLEENLIEPARYESVSWHGVDATFLGHNAVVIRSKDVCLLVDPWLVPAQCANERYRPIPRSLLGRVDAIAITHSHADHFDPGSLLQFDRRTQVLVPKVKRESLLTVDMARRLDELGFRHVRELEWGDSVKIGTIRLTALPFYGEQPTTSAQLFPDVRNSGNSYLIHTPNFKCALVADSGQDRAGQAREVAREAFLQWGPIDVLFSGFRGWNLYPVQFFESSIRQYLLFVPEHLWGVRQSIMNSVDDAIDTAEAWHATFIVPYGDGGAPWYADIGLGPQFNENGPEGEWEGFDSLPERVLKALSARAMPLPGIRAASSIRPLLLRPGDSFRLRGRRIVIRRKAPYAWPWPGEIT